MTYIRDCEEEVRAEACLLDATARYEFELSEFSTIFTDQLC